MKKYYVDVENVNDNWVDCFIKMNEGDIMNLYISKNTNFHYDSFGVVINSGKFNKLNMKRCIVDGKGNSILDYIILSDINTEIFNDRLKNLKYEYIILSNDKDYDKFVLEQTSNGINVRRENVEIYSSNDIVKNIESDILNSKKELVMINLEDEDFLIPKSKKEEDIKKLDKLMNDHLKESLYSIDLKDLVELYVEEKDLKKAIDRSSINIKDKSTILSRFTKKDRKQIQENFPDLFN